MVISGDRCGVVPIAHDTYKYYLIAEPFALTNEETIVKIETDRLDLIATTLKHVEAELTSTKSIAGMLGVEVGPNWPPGEYDRDAQEFFRDRLTEGGEAVVGWYGWYVIFRETSVLIGTGGYLGLPDEKGYVEIGFSIDEAWRQKGLATELAKALVDNAFDDLRVKKVIAHSAPDNAASNKVMLKSGFNKIGLDEQSGNIRYEFRRP